MSTFSPLTITDAYVSGGQLFQGADASGVLDSSAAVNYYLSIGGQIRAPKGTYRIKAALAFAVNGTCLWGDGFANTTFLIDDSGGNIGDLFTITNLRGCIITGMTIDAASARTAGGAVTIKGGSSIHLQAFGISLGGHIIDVDMNNQFNGVTIADNGSLGDWDTTIGTSRMANWRNFNSTGVAITLNTVHGASQTVQNIFMTCISGQSAKGVRVLATGGVLVDNVQTENFVNSFIMDPSAASADTVTLVQIRNCEFDVASGDNMLFNFQVGAVTPTFIDMTDNWIASAGGDGIHVQGAAGTGVLKHLTIKGGEILANSGYGVEGNNSIGTGFIIVDPLLYFGVAPLANALGNTHFT